MSSVTASQEMTVNGELNKLASNVALGRDFAGLQRCISFRICRFRSVTWQVFTTVPMVTVASLQARTMQSPIWPTSSKATERRINNISSSMGGFCRSSTGPLSGSPTRVPSPSASMMFIPVKTSGRVGYDD